MLIAIDQKRFLLTTHYTECKNSAQNVTGVKVPLSGHWTPEERPDLVNMLNNFFSGKPTSETSR